MSPVNTVLVVDDDPSIRTAMTRVLRVRGFVAEVFGSGEDCLARADLRAALCALLDVHLPGISGIELRRRIATSAASLPVIFMTANDSDATRRSAIEAGCVAYLSKPFSSQLLAGAIDAALAQRPR